MRTLSGPYREPPPRTWSGCKLLWGSKLIDESVPLLLTTHSSLGCSVLIVARPPPSRRGMRRVPLV